MILIETYWNVNSGLSNSCPTPEPILIETYWNVNSISLQNLPAFQMHINRDILECKFDLTGSRYDSKTILIETYWNVNNSREEWLDTQARY